MGKRQVVMPMVPHKSALNNAVGFQHLLAGWPSRVARWSFLGVRLSTSAPKVSLVVN